VIFGLAAALAYGTSDFIAGVLSRRMSFLQVAAVGQLAATLCTAAVLPLTAPPEPHPAALAWGAASGVGAALGTLALYRGLGSGKMAVAAPLSGVGAAALPAVAGFVLGERPSQLALAGIVLALPAVWLVSRPDLSTDDAHRWSFSAGVGDGLLAGVGFALLFLGLDLAGSSAGVWPVASAQLTSAVLLCAGAAIRRTSLLSDARSMAGAASVGVFGGAATVLFFVATHAGLLALAAVLTSLYPAFTVLLARLTLGERFGPVQSVGLGLAGLAVVLIVTG
jgi:drug/metabolite transporter (DMT)-like permease